MYAFPRASARPPCPAQPLGTEPFIPDIARLSPPGSPSRTFAGQTPAFARPETRFRATARPASLKDAALRARIPNRAAERGDERLKNENRSRDFPKGGL